MSLIAAILLLAGQQTGAARPQGQLSAPPLPFRFEAPIAPAVNSYWRCLQAGVGSDALDADRIEAAYEKGIRECAGQRPALIAAADRLLAREAGWSDPSRRRRSIEKSFADADAAQRREARRLRDNLRTRSQGAGGATVRIVRRTEEGTTLRFPREIRAPMSDYGNCLAASAGNLPPWFRNPPVEVGGDCAPFRQSAADESEQLLRGTSLNAQQRARAIRENLENVEAFMRRSPIPHPNAHQLSAFEGDD